MENLTVFFQMLFRLIEAELSEIKGKIVTILLVMGMCVIALLLLIGGFALILEGIYLALSLVMQPFIAAFVDAVIAFSIGGGLLLWAKRKMP